MLLNVPSSNKCCQTLVLLLSILEGGMGFFNVEIPFFVPFYCKEVSCQCYKGEKGFLERHFELFNEGFK